MKKIVFLLATALIVLSCDNSAKKSTDNTKDSIVERNEAQAIAYANGLEAWDKVEAIDFTFNVERDGKLLVSRAWTWKPKTDEITMTQNDETVSYARSTMDSLTIKTDQSFINDKYWLLAPFQLVWDETATTKAQDTATAPLSKQQMKMVTLTYPNAGGYTPGDAYDFYYTPDYEVKEWVFRKGNAAEPSMITTWEDYEDYDGIKIAKMHQRDGFKLYFTDVKVTTK